jgi:hypothetical protein
LVGQWDLDLVGKKESAPAPQPVAQVPQAPTYAQSVKDYVDNYPQLFALQEKYAPLEARQQLDLLNQYGPELSDYYSQEQQRLTPYTYGLQENLAKIAQDNMMGGIPDALRSSYIDQYRAEVGQNAGSPIGADYVSNNLARTAQDYNQYYQGLGLSLINKIPAQANTAQSINSSNTAGGLQNALGYNQGNYGNYVQGITNVPYTNGMYGGSNGLNFGGQLGSAASGAMAGSSFGPWGTAIGAGIGYFAGGR